MHSICLFIHTPILVFVPQLLLKQACVTVGLLIIALWHVFYFKDFNIIPNLQSTPARGPLVQQLTSLEAGLWGACMYCSQPGAGLEDVTVVPLEADCTASAAARSVPVAV